MNKKMTLQKKIADLFATKNTSLEKDLEIIEKKVGSANNLNELFDVFNFVKSLNLKFKNETLGKNYMTVFGLIFAGLWLLGVFMSRETFGMSKYFFWIMMSYMMLAFIHSGSFFRKVIHTKQISDSIIFKKVALDNNLIFEKINKKRLLQSFEYMFVIFYRGSCYKELIRSIKGEYESKFIYHYFNLHYIVENSSTSTDLNGKTTSSTNYEHHYLYGIITPFNGKNFVKISNCEKDLIFIKAYNLETGLNFIQWKTSSISFNKKFKVYTDQNQAAAVFLQPKVIEQIEKLYETFPELDIELSSQGFLALSTPDPELLNYTRQYGVDQLDLFKKELKKVLDQTKLHKALGFINFLKEYHEQI